MKNNSLHEGAIKIRAVTLSPEEKAAVFARLREHVVKHPARIVSPWRVYVSRFRFETVVAGALVLILTGGSVASAAKGALPGDSLYPVKIRVLEPVQGFFVSGDAPKARWVAEKTVRRLEEAEALAARGRLNSSAIEMVKGNFEKSANEFNAIVANAQASGSSEQIVNASVDFEARVNAHAQILSAVEQGPDREANDLSPLRSVVEENAHRARDQRANATPGTQQMFDDKVQAIQTMINRTEGRLNDASSVTVATSSVQESILRNVPETLKAAEESLRDAREKRDSGDDDKAYGALLDSESAAKQADTSLEQGLRWGKEKDKEKKDTADRGSD